MNTNFNGNYIQFALSHEEILQADVFAESEAVIQFREQLRRRRATYNSFLGQDGQGENLSWNKRRRIIGALRKSTMVLGVGQKSKIGHLGGGAALGAIAMGLSAPAFAQNFQVGGGAASGTNSAGGRSNGTAVRLHRCIWINGSRIIPKRSCN